MKGKLLKLSISFIILAFLISIFSINSFAATKYKVKITKLHCNFSEDLQGGDECSLKVYIDGEYKETLKHYMPWDSNWTINKTYTYTSKITFKLYDRDNPGFPLYDDDDYLGSATIGKNPSTDLSYKMFRKDECSYALFYKGIE